ncbi:Cof-type HAD-IIB family hydrolase [Liquorilactobacillus sicerae]|uniref:Cof-type HAD-IIB family hydrolase n=1 Tax=Liquorilactobacillus sicerae TaxID=1416943 RepID=UPI002480ACA1|nr:Cof-type HAD-IIB family hydrolase [Liquorilactobacillus sicerae]
MFPKLVFSDIDGTLLNSNHQITFETKKAILKTVAAGSKFIPVSARMPAAILPLIESLGLRMPFVSYNGALICDENNRELNSLTLSTELAEEICQDIENNYPELVWNVYSADFWLATDADHYWIKNEESIVGLKATRCRTVEEIAKLTAVHKLLLMGPTSKVDQYLPLLKTKYHQLAINQSAPHLIEITANKVEKSQAVLWMMNYYQVALEKTIAFGDNFNDLGMLKVVGNGYVMENAPQELKKLNFKQTLDNNHDGIAQILNHLFE